MVPDISHKCSIKVKYCCIAVIVYSDRCQNPSFEIKAQDLLTERTCCKNIWLDLKQIT